MSTTTDVLKKLENMKIERHKVYDAFKMICEQHLKKSQSLHTTVTHEIILALFMDVVHEFKCHRGLLKLLCLSYWSNRTVCEYFSAIFLILKYSKSVVYCMRKSGVMNTFKIKFNKVIPQYLQTYPMHPFYLIFIHL